MTSNVAVLFSIACLMACHRAVPNASTVSSVARSELETKPGTSFTVKVRGSGRPAVLIGDLGYPGEVWDSTIEHIAGKVETHVLEIAGFAGNPPIEEPLLPKLRGDLEAYLRAQPRRPIVIGHMFGATAAFWIAMTAPDTMSGLFVIDAPPARFEGSPEQLAEWEAVRKDLLTCSEEDFRLSVIGRTQRSIQDATIAERLGQQAALSTRAVYAQAFYDSMTIDLQSLIPNIRVPVLTLLTTENIPPTMRVEAEAYFRRQLELVNAKTELVVISNASHGVMFDQPEQYFEYLDRFLSAS